ncbi:AzlC family ABC transporter permease [Spirillospora sp. NPDC052269]
MIKLNGSDLRLAIGASTGAALYSAVFGALAVQNGWSVAQAMAASVFIHAGGAQLVGLAALGAGAAPLTAVAAGTLVNLRLGVFGFALGDVFASRRARFGAAHLVSDESAGAALTRATPAERRRTFVVVGLILFTGWTTGTLIGAVFGATLPDQVRGILDSAAAAVFAALVVPLIQGRRELALALMAFVVALGAVAHVAPGVPVLLGALMVVPAALVRRRSVAR